MTTHKQDHFEITATADRKPSALPHAIVRVEARWNEVMLENPDWGYGQFPEAACRLSAVLEYAAGGTGKPWVSLLEINGTRIPTQIVDAVSFEYGILDVISELALEEKRDYAEWWAANATASDKKNYLHDLAHNILPPF